MTRILLDLDGVLADWGHQFDRLLDGYGPAAAAIPRHRDQTTWNLNAGRSVDEKAIIAGVMRRPGFYANLNPIVGARSAVKQMIREGHDVHIVTSPYISNPTCASDKLAWVDTFLGIANHTVITSDKTLVRGDILIDDKPEIHGSLEPEWEHVLFDQPYNRHITDRRRIADWTEWRTLL